MINNIISIPIHEKAEVVIDQICNYKFFCPDCGIVLHISKGFNWKDSLLSEKEFLVIVNTFENVFVNPTRMNTVFADILHTYISNFEYVSKIVEFEYFSFGASNDLFVRPMPPISDCDANFNVHFFLKQTNLGWYPKVFKDKYLPKILEYLGADMNDVIKCQVEGSFYRKECFQEIVDIINKFYDHEAVADKSKVIFAREEIYCQTIFHILNKTRSWKIVHPNYTNVFWGNRGYLPTEQQIVDIAQGKVQGKYAVKRVLRNIDDPARFYIGTQIGNYRIQTLNLINSNPCPSLYRYAD